jgi:hypothetical protein
MSGSPPLPLSPSQEAGRPGNPLPTDLPRGYRFRPTDAELINHHLKPKLLGYHRPGKSIVIPEVDLRKVEPWDLPDTSRLDTSEWYVFNLRRHRGGFRIRVDRATPGGYWILTRKKRVMDDGNNRMVIGTKKTFFHYRGKAPKGTKNEEWVMHEYGVEV